VKPINTRKSKTLSFLIGLVYGYRTADMELKVFPLKEFRKENHKGFEIYYLSRRKDVVSKNEPIEDPTHIVALLEDIKAKKVRLYIYRK